ncbi:EF-P beta-lysylation protein EpmB [Ectothiorhodospira lacustris]|uniref:EF-P beta-lysylation protein EpmB n=1 Tax=Ectothiorhodospira lacustris TaxID=2899127 RepID=UPI001EE9A45B|nr:EF-P beta-lysylation protein EpmB [Ectothiorhodospira lacustris]MCG5500424.1 EF-P beta-lysylation protein EpmB [Ectothiorhodospira lacustris]MCG5509983.1 EF-P beta-lysylation protein EpmB [Ectothiorhodospira lacustris]MCG5521729.1 EF-P beta-lysylation protein EpmB [Ectothiorhodospira lacustris]
MITRLNVHRQSADWQRALAQAVTDPEELLKRLGLDPALLPAAREASKQFRVRVPLGYLGRMTPGDPNDPLLRQVLPLGEECLEVPDFHCDPVGDLESMPIPGLLHKYHGRVLLVTSGTCAIHCRYCFRRHFPYRDASAIREAWPRILLYLRTHQEVREVILSGGDPLTLSDDKLAAMISDLAGIPHLRTLRLHSRLPVVVPERIDDTLLGWLTGTRLRPVMVIHANHARELDGTTRAAMERLELAGVRLFNQTVLLRGVNDDPDVLATLSHALFDSGVQPYYLHTLDPVQGAAHFAVSETHALAIMDHLTQQLPGYLIPRLVQDIPGRDSKTPLVRSFPTIGNSVL